jgi:hypothetical protein
MRQTLKEAATAGQFYTTAVPGGLSTTPLAALLDGWKIIKVWVNELETLESHDATL